MSETVFVFPISSNMEKRKYRVIFRKDDIADGRIAPGSILVQQGRTISTFRFDRKMGRLGKERLLEVQEMFDDLLYKNTPLRRKPSGGKGG